MLSFFPDPALLAVIQEADSINFISRYTPSLMSPETLEAIFVQRHRLVEDLIELIRESALTANKHYRLLVGMRGIGKTHTIAIIHHRLAKMDDLRDKLLIAWLQEEEWGVSSFLDLLLRILRSLAKAYPVEYQAKLEKQVEFLYELSFAEAEQEAGRILREFARGRTLLLLIENLDELFKGLGDIGQKQFRAYLQNYGFVTILATAQSLFDDISLQAHPFYGFFYPYELEKLTLNEACSLLSKIAETEDDSELKEFIQSSVGRDRIAAIHHLAGGNHRVYVIFSQFLTRESLDNLVDPFMQTLDNLTPYYQARMQWLSVQQRKIVEVLYDHRHPITVKEIAKACFITHQTTSSQLKDLREKGYVTSEFIGRESFYELQEPLMRICLEVKKHRGEPIKLFVDFLRVWYTQDELKQQLEKLPSHLELEREYLLKALKEAQEETEYSLIKNYSSQYEKYPGEITALEVLEVAEKLASIRNHPSDWLIITLCLLELKYYQETLSACDRLIKLVPNESSAWFLQGLVFERLGQKQKALSAWDNSIKLDPNSVNTWDCRGILLFELNSYEEALENYQKALSLNPNATNLWYHYGLLQSKQNNYEKVLEAFNKVLELGSNDYVPWLCKSMSLYKLGYFDGALSSCHKAIELEDGLLSTSLRTVILLAREWSEGIIALDDVLKQAQETKQDRLINPEHFLENLICSNPNVEIWRTRSKEVLAIYEKYQVDLSLMRGLVESIPVVMADTVSDKAARSWLEIWEEVAGHKREFKIPLGFLNVAVEYKEKKGDRRVLLKLPIEKRKLLEHLLRARVGTVMDLMEKTISPTLDE